MIKKPAWKRVSSGKYVDLNDLHPTDIKLKDIEVSLNNTVRFNGHSGERTPLTVAQHSWLCLQLAKEMYPDDKETQLAVFVHDFAEAYIGDISTPVKRALGPALRAFTDPIEEMVEYWALGYYITPDTYDKVKLCDMTSLDIERRAMWNNQSGEDYWPTGHAEFGLVCEKVALFEQAKGMGYINFEDIYNEFT